MRRWGVVRRVAALLLLVAVAVACGGDDDPSVVAPDRSSTSTSAAPAPGEPPVTAPASPGSTAAPGDQAAPPPTTPQSAPPDTRPAGSPQAAWPALDGSGSPGTFAPDLLRRDRSARIEVRVSSQQGREPRQRTLDHLLQVLRSVSGGKEVVVTGGATVPSRETWTADQLRAAAGPVEQGRGTAVVRLLFVGGRYADAEGVLGVSVRGDAAAVFSDEVDRSGSPLVGPAAIEDAVTIHELGHLLGLVDLLLSTGREDPEHPGHSRNRESVMYWAVESTLVADVLTGGPPREFDAQDLQDLARIRSGA